MPTPVECGHARDGNLSFPADGPEPIAVIGAGVIGSAIAWRLTREGHAVLLIDRAEPARAGASFGNAGHIACEQLTPLPSVRLLLSFWRELSVFDGPVHIPLRRVAALAPWLARFTAAALHQRRNTPALAALVRPAAESLERALRECGQAELLVRRGHYSFWFGPRAPEKAAREALEASRLQVRTEAAPRELTGALQRRSPGSVCGLWYPDSGHVLDPQSVAAAFVQAAVRSGARFQQSEVRQILPEEGRIVVRTDSRRLTVRAAVVCAGVQSAPLLRPFGLNAPLTAERGYHLELPGTAPLTEAPVVYADEHIIVTPMRGRLRATSYLEFERHGAPPDARKLQRLRAALERLGYTSETRHEGWVGSRPTLPDYLPGIGRAPGQAPLYYAIGHQHLGLTLAAPTAEVIAALVAGRDPPLDVRPLDLRRFGPHPRAARP